jgi:predicted Zn-dependent peptidase
LKFWRRCSATDRASRLNQYLRDEKQLITSGSAGLQSFSEVGFFEIDAQTAKPVEAQIGILAEVENIKRFGLTDEAVARAKTMIVQRRLTNWKR